MAKIRGCWRRSVQTRRQAKQRGMGYGGCGISCGSHKGMVTGKRLNASIRFRPADYLSTTKIFIAVMPPSGASSHATLTPKMMAALMVYRPRIFRLQRFTFTGCDRVIRHVPDAVPLRSASLVWRFETIAVKRDLIAGKLLVRAA